MQYVLQPVLRDDHCRSELQIDLPDCVQKVRRRYRIQLARWLVQYEHFRLHRHYRHQVQQLLLPAGKLRHILVEPPLDPEVACHFRDAQAHRLLINAEAFKSESQLVPDLVCDHLIVGVLHDIADHRRLFPESGFLQRSPAEKYIAGLFPMRSQHAFQVPQQRSLAASAPAAYRHVTSSFYFKIYIVQCRTAAARIVKRQIFDLKMRHFISSVMFTPAGIIRKIPYEISPATETGSPAGFM